MHGIEHDHCLWQPGKKSASKDMWSCKTDKTGIWICQGILCKYFNVKCFTKQLPFQNPNKFSMQRNTRLEVRKEQAIKDRWIYSYPTPLTSLPTSPTESTGKYIRDKKEVLCPFTYLYNLQQPHIFTSTRLLFP